VKLLELLFESKEKRVVRERAARVAAEAMRKRQTAQDELLRRADRLESRVGVSVWHDAFTKD
jgi:hypothetical protein